MSDEKMPERARKVLLGLSAIVFVVAAPLASRAEEGLSSNGEAAGALSQSTDALSEDGRYGLVEMAGDVLRVDRKTGTVSFCRKSQDSWRCMPAPVAEDAYQADIGQLDEEVDRLKARIRELEAQIAALQTKTDEGSGSVPGAEPENGKPEPQTSVPGQSDEGASKPAPHLSEEDEHQLQRMMDFSEKAMRRFYGLMRDLQKEFSTQ